MAIRFDSADSFNNFFNTSLGRKNNSTNLFDSINLSDYNSLKTGTYKKLLRSYYDKLDTSKDDSVSDVKDKLMSDLKNDSGVSKEIASNSDKVNKIADELKEIDYEENNRNNIVKKVSDLVSSYNKILDGVEETKDNDIITKGKWMTNYTKSFEEDFKKIGIKIEESNRLSIDEASLKKAKLDDIKDLFVPKSSFGNNIVTVSGIDTYL